jgi:hypothetical protein
MIFIDAWVEKIICKFGIAIPGLALSDKSAWVTLSSSKSRIKSRFMCSMRGLSPLEELGIPPNFVKNIMFIAEILSGTFWTVVCPRWKDGPKTHVLIMRVELSIVGGFCRIVLLSSHLR